MDKYLIKFEREDCDGIMRYAGICYANNKLTWEGDMEMDDAIKMFMEKLAYVMERALEDGTLKLCEPRVITQ